MVAGAMAASCSVICAGLTALSRAQAAICQTHHELHNVRSDALRAAIMASH
jgi:hypothetical protein